MLREYIDNQFFSDRAVIQGELGTDEYEDNEEPEETDLQTLIHNLPNSSELYDPNGTKYYFYNQLLDLEKVLYWKIYNAEPEDPVFKISGIDASMFADETDLRNSVASASSAVMSDYPEVHMLWNRYVETEINSVDGSVCCTLTKTDCSSDYRIKKAKARIDEIKARVGDSGDTYSKLRKFCTIMYKEMDYNDYYVFVSNKGAAFDDSALGCLVKNYAVCAGFSDCTKILCDELGIPCIIVGNAGHAWNYIKMDDGLWYSVDMSYIAGSDAFDDPQVQQEHFLQSLLIGSNSPEYVGSTNYHLSELYIGTEGDFQFPELSQEQYVYNGTYTESFNQYNNTFAEKDAEFIYKINEDGQSCSIVDFEGEEKGDLEIPGSLGGYTVTAILDESFFFCRGFTGKLTIPDSVKVIDEGAFIGCDNLTGSLGKR